MNGYISSKNHITMNDECTLLNVSWKADDFGVQREQDGARTSVFCGRLSVTGKEYYEGGGQGLKPEAVLVIHAEEYAGQNYVDYAGKRYTIYRTFERTDGLLELYCTEKAGDK